MEFYFIYDTSTGLYFIQNNEPFYYVFTKPAEADLFCRSHPGTRIETQYIENEEDNSYMAACLYQRGFKGGWLDGEFHAVNQSNPELMRLIPENAGLLSLLLFRGTGKKSFIQNQRFYFFATITDSGYLAFANTNGYIFGFTDIESMDTRLARQLYSLGYEPVKYYIDGRHKYLLNANKATQCRIAENFVPEPMQHPRKIK